MRTLAHCRAHDLTLFTYCKACDLRAPAAPICRAFNGWTVDELERASAIACRACGGPGHGVSVMGEHWGMKAEVEHWRGEYGFMRKIGADGFSG